MTTYSRSIPGAELVEDDGAREASLPGSGILSRGSLPTLAQYFVTADVDAGTWTSNQGGSLYAAVDEASVSDVDYIQSALGPSADTAILAFGNCLTPIDFDNVTLRYRIKGIVDCNLTVKLMSGTDEIASWDHTPAPTVFTTYERAIDAGTAATINFPSARLKLIAG